MQVKKNLAITFGEPVKYLLQALSKLWNHNTKPVNIKTFPMTSKKQFSCKQTKKALL